MGILLGILKITGITLLIILLIIIVLLCIVLFVPIRYHASVFIPEKDLDAEGTDIKEGTVGKAGFHWLLYLVRGGIAYPDEMQFWLKVLFFTILPASDKSRTKREERRMKREQRKSEEKIKKAEAAASESQESENAVDNGQINEDISSENDGLKTTDSVKPDEQVDASDAPETEADDSHDSQEHETSDSTESEENHERASIIDKIVGFFDFVQDFFDNIFDFMDRPIDALDKAFYTLSRVCDKMDLALDILYSDTFDRAFTSGKREIIRVLKSIKPRRVKADILFGTGDPADTANVMSGVALLNTFSNWDIDLDADFDRKVIGANAIISGKITLFTILLSLARLYFNRDIKRVLKGFNRVRNI